jgi:hypothetical protein
MEWLETITIRCAGSREKRAVMDLLQKIGMPEGEAGLVAVELYQSALLESDVSVHIHACSGRFGDGKSSLGLRLTHALSDFGLISHSLWVPEGRVPPKKLRTNHKEQSVI